jgi:hypothetical protein
VQPLHVLDVQGLQAVAGGRDEVEAGVDARIRQGEAVYPRFGVQERLILSFHILYDGRPTIRVVDGVAEARRVHDGQRQVDARLPQQHLVRVHLRGNENDMSLLAFLSLVLVLLLLLASIAHVQKCSKRQKLSHYYVVASQILRNVRHFARHS